MEKKSVKKNKVNHRQQVHSPEAHSTIAHKESTVVAEKEIKSAPETSKPKKSHAELAMSERDIAVDFATKAHQKFDRLIKASVLFGSQAKKTAGAGSDIDIILIIDDAAVAWDLELIAWYREELGKLIKNCNYSKELHINTVKLTTWWNDLLEGDPVIINILRYGEVLIDSGGFFNPLKILLQQGRIKSTVESVYAALQRAPSHLLRSKASKLNAIEGIYWSMVDSSQAALITAGKLPPSPEHIPGLLQETFVITGMCKPSSVSSMREIHTLHKKVAHGDIHDIKGADIDRWQEIAQAFLLEMTRIIDVLVDQGKKGN